MFKSFCLDSFYYIMDRDFINIQQVFFLIFFGFLIFTPFSLFEIVGFIFVLFLMVIFNKTTDEIEEIREEEGTVVNKGGCIATLVGVLLIVLVFVLALGFAGMAIGMQ